MVKTFVKLTLFVGSLSLITACNTTPDSEQKNATKEVATRSVASTPKQSCGDTAHGDTKTGYLRPTTKKRTPCPTGTNTCNNGTWVGPKLYDVCTETP